MGNHSNVHEKHEILVNIKHTIPNAMVATMICTRPAAQWSWTSSLSFASMSAW